MGIYVFGVWGSGGRFQRLQKEAAPLIRGLYMLRDTCAQEASRPWQMTAALMSS